MAKRRCFPFVYHTAQRKGRKLWPFRMRDLLALQELLTALGKRGYSVGDMILNYPMSLPASLPLASVPPLDRVDYSFLTENDLIVLPTRPPMHDRALGDRRGSERSFTELEALLFQGPLSRWFKTCGRSEIHLAELAASVCEEIRKRQTIIVRQNVGATYQSYGSPVTGQWADFKGPHSLTPAFLVYAEHAWPGGPAFLAAFGMGGIETLVWCHQLATKYSDLLCSKPFAMAEMRTVPCDRPSSLAFADAWEVTILGAAEPASTSDPSGPPSPRARPTSPSLQS